MFISLWIHFGRGGAGEGVLKNEIPHASGNLFFSPLLSASIYYEPCHLLLILRTLTFSLLLS